MKISYERLNQIIEEEVVRFKKLNEDLSPNDMTDVKVLRSAITTLMDNDKITATDLAPIYSTLNKKAKGI